MTEEEKLDYAPDLRDFPERESLLTVVSAMDAVSDESREKGHLTTALALCTLSASVCRSIKRLADAFDGKVVVDALSGEFGAAAERNSATDPVVKRMRSLANEIQGVIDPASEFGKHPRAVKIRKIARDIVDVSRGEEPKK